MIHKEETAAAEDKRRKKMTMKEEEEEEEELKNECHSQIFDVQMANISNTDDDIN